MVLALRTKVSNRPFEIDDFIPRVSELLLKLEMPHGRTESNLLCLWVPAFEATLAERPANLIWFSLDILPSENLNALDAPLWTFGCKNESWNLDF